MQTLVQQLKNFGLNPGEWRLHSLAYSQTKQVVFSHRDDEQFRLYGMVARTDLQSPTLKNLRLLSI